MLNILLNTNFDYENTCFMLKFIIWYIDDTCNYGQYVYPFTTVSLMIF